MGKYDNVTMKEYMKKKKEMLDDLGRKSEICNGAKCENCPFNTGMTSMTSCYSFEMLNPDKVLEIVMEYKPKVDWSKVERDTKVLVADDKEGYWYKRYFAGYYDGIIYTYPNGLSSFTYDKDADETFVPWKNAKLYKGDE